MASILKHLRSSTANKRPTASGLADGQIAINTASGTPALFFKDSASNIVKVGPAHVGSTAPNTSPAGSAGNSTGELWVDNGLTTNGLKYYNGTAFVNLTPSGTTSTIGLVELATDAETQAGTDAARAVTPSGLQSKISDSTSTSSSTTIASSTAVKSAYDLADAALPKAGGTITGAVTISPSGSLSFEGATDDSFETTLAVVDPTADRTITLPNVTGTVITTGDSGTVTSTMIADGTIVDADISATAEIAVSKLADGSARQLLQTDSAGTGVEWASNIDIPGTLDVTGAVAVDSTFAASGATTLNSTLSVTGAVTGSSTVTASGFIPTGSTAPTNGMYLPSANNVAISTNGTGRLFIGSTGTVNFTGAGTTGSTQAVSFNGSAPVNSLVIDSSGRLGLGTSSPSAPLQVQTASDTTIAISNSSSVTSGNRAQLAVYNSSVSTVGQIRFGAVTDNVGTDIQFWTRPAAGSLTQTMTLDSTGRLGIGTTSPNSTLNIVADSGAVGLTIQNRTANDYGYLRFQNNAGTETQAYIGCERSGTSAGRLLFETAGSERMRIDESGRLLVGTSSALTGTDTQYSRMVVTGNTSGPSAAIMSLSRPEAATNITTDEVLGIISFADNGAGEYARITCAADANAGSSDYPGRLVFSVTKDGAPSPTERIRLANDGNSFFFTAGNTTITSASSTGAGTVDVLYRGRYSATSTTSGTDCLYIFTNGNIQNTNNSYTGISDIKLKENIVNANSQWADIKALQVRSYNFKEGQTHRQIGLVAQEVEPISPGLVYESPDRDENGNDLGTVTKSVNYSVLYMKAVKALQEAMERIEVLEQRLTDAGIA